MFMEMRYVCEESNVKIDCNILFFFFFKKKKKKKMAQLLLELFWQSSCWFQWNQAQNY